MRVTEGMALEFYPPAMKNKWLRINLSLFFFFFIVFNAIS